MAPKILIGPSSFGEADDLPLKILSDSGMSVVDNPYKRRLTEIELRDLLTEDKDIIGIIAGLEPLNRGVLQDSSLKVISRCGSGLSNVDLEAAKDFEIKVFSTPDGPMVAVAELTIGALIALMRSVPLMDRSMRAHEWNKIMGYQLRGKKVAVVGFGLIGQEVSRLLGSLGAEVLAVDPAFGDEVEGVPIFPLDEVITYVDVITLHASGESVILGEAQFQAMKDGVFVLNSARGELIEESALINALDKGRVAGAWMDAFWKEPYIGPLLDYDQVIVTPHVGSYSREGRIRMETEAVENLLAGFEGLRG